MNRGDSCWEGETTTPTWGPFKTIKKREEGPQLEQVSLRTVGIKSGALWLLHLSKLKRISGDRGLAFLLFFFPLESLIDTRDQDFSHKTNVKRDSSSSAKSWLKFKLGDLDGCSFANDRAQCRELESLFFLRGKNLNLPGINP